MAEGHVDSEGAASDSSVDRVKSQKNIVLCSDGTGNSGGIGHETNVWRLYQAVDLDGHRHHPQIPRQMAFYADGVGSQGFTLDKLFGGAFGWGLGRNVRDLYELLATHYEPGDSVYLFGFSRGAFTARSLGGLACRIGVLDVGHEFTDAEKREILVDAAPIRVIGYLKYRLLKFSVSELTHPELVKLGVMAAFRRYRRRRMLERPVWPRPVRDGLRRLAKKFMPGFDPYRETGQEAPRPAYYHKDFKIRCIGVWDTVGALGTPLDALREPLDRLFRINFHSTGLHHSVEAGYHALAIDDERETFHPILWDEHETSKQTHIEQVWFAGAHSNVGGGYPKQGMAHVSLDWMMRRATQRGLVFHEASVEHAHRRANVNDKLYDPRSGFGAYYRYQPRNIEALCRKCRVAVHASAFERIASGVQNYSPANLPLSFAVVDDEGTTRQLPWAGLVKEHIEAHGDRLRALRRQAWRFIDYRRWHYNATLIWTFAILACIAELGSRDNVQPASGYRLAAVAVAGAVLLWLRGLLRYRAERGFIAFWGDLRRRLRGCDSLVQKAKHALHALDER